MICWSFLFVSWNCDVWSGQHSATAAYEGEDKQNLLDNIKTVLLRGCRAPSSIHTFIRYSPCINGSLPTIIPRAPLLLFSFRAQAWHIPKGQEIRDDCRRNSGNGTKCTRTCRTFNRQLRLGRGSLLKRHWIIAAEKVPNKVDCFALTLTQRRRLVITWIPICSIKWNRCHARSDRKDNNRSSLARGNTLGTYHKDLLLQYHNTHCGVWQLDLAVLLGCINEHKSD